MTVQWRVVPEESGAIASALHALMTLTRAEPGCVGCWLTTELGRKATFHYSEEWKEESDLKRQLRSERFARLAELVERAVERPVIEFLLGAKVRGIDYAEEVRRRGETS
jgi:quinol monooxygenase YgiN